MSDLSRLTGQHNCRYAGQVNCRSIDDSARKVVYLAIMDASKKRTMPIRNWKLAVILSLKIASAIMYNQDVYTELSTGSKIFQLHPKT